MSIDQHVENRAWAFQALDEIQGFLNDPDFEGESEEESIQIDRKRKELREGKYRVVFLGAFNVGKSTLINAFLGDEYLPTILEECTTKITHVTRADEMRIVIMLTAEAAQSELDTLRDLLNAYGLRCSIDLSSDREINILFTDPSAKALVQSLRALTTMSADEDYPQLRSLRNKYEELFVYVQNDRLEEDVALVDSPGVHSISETNRKVAHDIIPDSHLVVCMLDSQTAGNEQSRDFIERIIKHRHRKVFFVMNKADQLNPDEIDPSGRRGPAKDLLRSLEGILEGPELFFVSSLYALLAAELQRGRISLDQLDENNKVKIPFSVMRNIVEGGSPEEAAAQHLLDRSNFPSFKRRLLDYLYTENREGAIVQSACRFVDNKAWRYARPLVVKLDLAKSVPRLDELKLERQQQETHMAEHRREADAALRDYDTMSGGGRLNGREYPGYEALVDSQVNRSTVQNQVVKPSLAWVHTSDRFKEAKRDQYQPVVRDVDQRVEAFLAEVEAAVNAEVDAVEVQARERLAEQADSADRLPTAHAHATRPALGPVNISLAGSYFGWMIAGALILGIAGAAAFGAFLGTPQGADALAQGLEVLRNANVTIEPAPPATRETGMMLGGIGGVIKGAVIGLILRALTANGTRRKRLERILEERINSILLTGRRSGGQASDSVRDQLKEGVQLRRTHFRNSYSHAFEKGAAGIQGRLDAIQEEEQQLLEEQRATIARLEPKIEQLQGLGRDAHAIAEKGAPEHPLRFAPVEDEATLVEVSEE